MSRLRRYLLANVSHVSIARAWGARAWAGRDQDANPDTAASATPSSVDHGEASQPPIERGTP
jgi:hypothetical protein